MLSYIDFKADFKLGHCLGCLFSCLLINSPASAQGNPAYIQYGASIPYVRDTLAAWRKNYAADPSVRESTAQDVYKICYASRVAFNRGMPGWGKSIKEALLVGIKTKNYNDVVASIYFIPFLSKSCPEVE